MNNKNRHGQIVVQNGKALLNGKRVRDRRYFFGKSKQEKIVYGIAFTIFILWSIALLYPVLWVLLNSLKGRDQYFENITPGTGNPFALPEIWNFGNYIEAFNSIQLRTATGYATMWEMLFNTIWYCVLRVGMGVFVPLATAYVMAKYRFHGRAFIYSFVVISMIIPIFGTGGAAFTFYYDIGVYNSPLFVIFTGLGGFGGSFLIMYGYFKSVSWEYAEAVFVDGGGHFTVFFKIMIPMAVPIIITFSVLGFIGSWNDYGTMLIYLPDYPTLASGVYSLSQGNNSLMQFNPPVYFAVLVIMMIPVLVLFICMQDIIMNNMTIGGIKG